MASMCSYGKPVYFGKEYKGKNPNGPVPDSFGQKLEKVYLYLMRVEPDGSIDCTVCENKVECDGLDAAIREILKAPARYAIKNATLEDSEWWEPGYLVFIMDSPSWSLLTDETGNANAIHFAIEKGHPQKANETFFDSVTKKVEVNGKEREALVVANYHLTADGKGPRRKGDKTTDDYKYDIYYKVKLGNSGKDVVVVLDPGGKNKGP